MFLGENICSQKKQPVIISKAHADQITAVEVIWAMKTTSSDLPFSVSDDIGDILRAMVPGPVSERLRMASSKTSYLVAYGLRPYFTRF